MKTKWLAMLSLCLFAVGLGASLPSRAETRQECVSACYAMYEGCNTGLCHAGLLACVRACPRA